jgi:hypothetical protein
MPLDAFSTFQGSYELQCGFLIGPSPLLPWRLHQFLYRFQHRGVRNKGGRDTLREVTETLMAAGRLDLESQQKIFLFRISPIISLMYISQSVVWLWDFFSFMDSFVCPATVLVPENASDKSDFEVNGNNIDSPWLTFLAGRCGNVCSLASYCHSSIPLCQKTIHSLLQSVDKPRFLFRQIKVLNLFLHSSYCSAIWWQQVSSLSLAFFQLLN